MAEKTVLTMPGFSIGRDNGTGNGTVQFTFFFIMGLNFTIITSCDSLIVILAT